MKPRFPIALPPPGSPARLPALLVPALAGLAALQLALPQRMDLPEEVAVGRVAMPAAPAAPAPVVVPPGLAARNPFQPDLSARPDAPPPDPLNGAVVAGTVNLGRGRMAVVAMGDGKVRYVALGGVVAAGWRLAAFDDAGARLTRGGETLKLAYGRHPVVAVPGRETKQEEDEQ